MPAWCYHSYMLNVTFAEIAAELQGVEAGLDAAEAHGCLCGALCTINHFSASLWLQELIPDDADHEHVVSADPAPAAISAGLHYLFTESERALRSDAMEFIPLLPDDDEPLAARVGALAHWAQGFLYGFGIGVQALPGALPEEVSEVLQDFSQITRANPAEVTDSDEDEQAYTELVEYLRAAVQLVHDNLSAQRVQQAAAMAH